MDLADEFQNLRIIALGAVDTARQVVEYDPEMRHRVSEFLVPLMTIGEIRSIKRGMELLNISMPSGVMDGIVAYSNGLASVCHQLCLNVCQAAGIDETSEPSVDIGVRTLEDAVSQYLNDASDTFKAAFDKARRLRKKAKYDNVNLILRALIELPSDGGTHAGVLAKIREWEKAYPDSNARYFLDALKVGDRGEIIRFDSASGKYSFSDPVYRIFATTLFKQSSSFNPKGGATFRVQWKI